MGYHIHYACVSHVGKIRSMNQDNFICDGHYMQSRNDETKFPLCGTKTSDEISVFGVFDGMGGEECGEVASYIASQNAAALEIENDPTDELLAFCQKANADICSYIDENELSSMGTTAAMLVFTPKFVTLCNIGDSKVFRFSDGVLEQISQDHLAIAAFGVKPPLSQNLGIPSEEMLIDPYLAQGSYHHRDMYLICSDGLTDMVSNEEIGEVLKAFSPAECANILVEKALENGGRDTITLIVLEIQRQKNKLLQFLSKFVDRK